MNKLCDSVRRLGTAIMILAACAFAFHAGAVAADFGDAPMCTHTGIAAHEHADAVGAAHTDGDHIDLTDAGDQHAGQTHDGHGKAPCCGTGCTIAVLALGAISLEPTRTLTVRTPLPLAVALSGTDLPGLKRPPRLLPLG